MAGDYVIQLASYSDTFVCVYPNLRIQQHRAFLSPTFPRYPVRIVPTNTGSKTCGHASYGAIAGAQHHVEVADNQNTPEAQTGQWRQEQRRQEGRQSGLRERREGDRRRWEQQRRR